MTRADAATEPDDPGDGPESSDEGLDEGSDEGPDHDSDEASAEGTAFELAGVGVTRGGTTALSDVSATLAAGRCTGLVGPSGAGKSTLLRILNRLIEPDTGTAAYRGKPLTSYDVRRLRRTVGLVAQAPVILTDTIADEVRVGAPDIDDATVTGLLERVGLEPSFAERGTDGLSGGEAQRVCLARTLAVDPQVLLLDEPTSALDPASTRIVEEIVRGLVAGGLTAILVSHDAAQALRVADEVIVLRAGRVAEQGPAHDVDYLKGTT